MQIRGSFLARQYLWSDWSTIWRIRQTARRTEKKFHRKSKFFLPTVKIISKSVVKYFLRPEIKGALGLFCTLKIQILGKSIAP
jgi:hypothetical protein